MRPAPLRDVSDWVGHYRKFWEQSFDRLEAYLKQVQAEETEKHRKRR